MNLNVPDNSQLRLQLRDHQIFSTDQAEGLVLECLRGGVWATFDGDRADHFLQPGERFVVSGHGQAVIQALEDSEIALFPMRQDLPVSVGRDATAPRSNGSSLRGACSAGCSNLAESATECWRNAIAGLTSTRLGLERTF